MTAPTLSSLASDIFLIRGLLEPYLCTHIIEVAQFRQLQAPEILLEAVDTEVSSSEYLRLGGDDPLLQSTNQLLYGKLMVVQELLFDCYGIQFPYAEPCSILHYREGQFYKRHVDNMLLSSRFQEVEQGIPTRDVSVVGYLNDDFEGGETYFDRQSLKVKPEAGAVLVFPAYFTHPHEALPVLRGEKYAFTSWLFH